MTRKPLFIATILLSLCALNVSAQVTKDTVCIENPLLKAYLDEPAYNSSDYTYSHISKYATREYGKNDKPLPVVFKCPSDGCHIVEVFEVKNRRKAILSAVQENGADSICVWNLTPGKSYFYKEHRQGCKGGLSGRFFVQGRRTMLRVDSVNNVRDLGGIRTNDGRAIAFGRIIRGGELDGVKLFKGDSLVKKRVHIQPQGLDVLKNQYRISADIDLRNDKGLGKKDNDPSNDINGSFMDWGVEYFNHPVKAFDVKELKSGNNEYGKTLKDILNCLKNGLNVYIHCSAGADRTGIICLMIEAMAGADESEMVRDYEITSFARGKGDSHRRNREDHYHFKPAIEYLKTFEGTNLSEQVCDYLIKKQGITSEDINALRSYIVR